VEIKVVEIKKQQIPQMDGIPWEFFFGTPLIRMEITINRNTAPKAWVQGL